MSAPTQAENATWRFSFSQAEWDQTPAAVQTHLLAMQTQLHDLQQQYQQLQIQVDQLQGRVDQTSKTSGKPRHPIRHSKNPLDVAPQDNVGLAKVTRVLGRLCLSPPRCKWFIAPLVNVAIAGLSPLCLTTLTK